MAFIMGNKMGKELVDFLGLPQGLRNIKINIPHDGLVEIEAKGIVSVEKNEDYESLREFKPNRSTKENTYIFEDSRDLMKGLKKVFNLPDGVGELNLKCDIFGRSSLEIKGIFDLSDGYNTEDLCRIMKDSAYIDKK